jgi:hypothetical protein
MAAELPRAFDPPWLQQNWISEQGLSGVEHIILFSEGQLSSYLLGRYT